MTGKRLATIGVLLFSLGLTAPDGRGADDDREPAKTVTKAQAKAALDRFKEEFRSRDEDDRVKAIRRLERIPHPDVAKRLLRVLAAAHEPAVVAATCEALSGQACAVDRVGPAVEKLFRREAARKMEMFQRGDPGFLLDSMNDPDVKSEAGRKAFAELAARDQMIAAALRCLLELDYHEHIDATVLEPMLRSAEDELVLAGLEAISKFSVWSALPAVHFLFKMYPRENRWETGYALDLRSVGTSMTSKGKWMLIFGHPEKQKARPKVVEGIKTCVKALTGTEVEDPEDLEALLRRKDIKEHIEEAKHEHRR